MRLRILLLAAALVSCGPAGGSRYTRKQAQDSLGKLDAPGLVVGEFRLTKVVDGDTLRVDGLDSSLRLLGIDTEEIFHSQNVRRQFENGWEQYLKAERGDSKHPVKMSTPVGEDAMAWAKQFFEGVTTVRIERDDARQIRDRYGRYLAYVFAQKNGVWLNYNVEAVRAGMAPYFPKYGFSRRFHDEFVEAEKEAKAAHIGIWDPDRMHYPDYDEREPWWWARGEFVKQFEDAAEGKEDTYIDLTDFDAMKRIEAALGKEIVVLATVGDVRRGDKGPTKVMLSRKMHGGDFPLIFFDKDVFASTGIAGWVGEFVTARGVVTEYENKHTHRKQLQLVIDRPGQITLSQVPGLEVSDAP
jgi:endonuclease YncB( thermonuclease family)